MDVEYAIALASAASGGAASSAGQSAWQALVSLGRRALGRTEAAGPAEATAEATADATADAVADAVAGTEPEPAGVDPADDEAVRVLIGRISERARTDETFAAELCRWAETHGAAIRVDQSRAGNTIAGNASVTTSIQVTGDFNGNISI